MLLLKQTMKDSGMLQKLMHGKRLTQGLRLKVENPPWAFAVHYFAIYHGPKRSIVIKTPPNI